MEGLVKIFKALNDETRINILLLVSKRNICQRGISKNLGISCSAVSQHIKVLKDSGIITGVKEGYYVLYNINEGVFDKVINFINSLSNEANDESFSLNKFNETMIGCNDSCKSIKKCCKRKG